ncbi:hypothetical protein L218DRAFT_952005, partial [Marasmius fiardii PR-910]
MKCVEGGRQNVEKVNTLFIDQGNSEQDALLIKTSTQHSQWLKEKTTKPQCIFKADDIDKKSYVTSRKKSTVVNLHRMRSGKTSTHPALNLEPSIIPWFECKGGWTLYDYNGSSMTTSMCFYWFYIEVQEEVMLSQVTTLIQACNNVNKTLLKTLSFVEFNPLEHPRLEHPQAMQEAHSHHWLLLILTHDEYTRAFQVHLQTEFATKHILVRSHNTFSKRDQKWSEQIIGHIRNLDKDHQLH